MELGREPDIGYRFIRSKTPFIYGRRHLKTAIAMSLFIGVHKNINDKQSIRGGESQVLKYAEKLLLALLQYWKGCTCCWSYCQCPQSSCRQGMDIEGGALVLADRGLCLML